MAKQKTDSLELDALRGAFVSLKNDANQYRNQAQTFREEADALEKRAVREERMAEAAKVAFVKLGGDPAIADNWYSWSYDPDRPV